MFHAFAAGKSADPALWFKWDRQMIPVNDPVGGAVDDPAFMEADRAANLALMKGGG